MRLPAPAAALLVVAALAFSTPRAFAQQTGITLHWTAPGDDGHVGRAARYELRWSNDPIGPLSFLRATIVPGLPAPAPAGTRESFTVTGLDPRRTHYFMIRAQDDAGHWSTLSNLAAHVGVTTDVTGGAATLELGPATPNPARESTRFRLTLPIAGDVRIHVFDLAGRRVRTLVDARHGAGVSDVVWDLRDDRGSALEPGVYLVRGEVGSRRWLRRVALVR